MRYETVEMVHGWGVIDLSRNRSKAASMLVGSVVGKLGSEEEAKRVANALEVAYEVGRESAFFDLRKLIRCS